MIYLEKLTRVSNYGRRTAGRTDKGSKGNKDLIEKISVFV